MTTAPHPSGAADRTTTDATAPGKAAGRNGSGRRPWYLRVRFVAPLAVIAAAVAGVVALSFQDPDATSSRRGTGSHVAETSTYDEVFGSFEPVTTSGSGRGSIPLPPGASAGIVTATYEGSGFFDVGFQRGMTAYSLISWVGVRGPYHGSVPFGLFSGPQADSLRVWTSEGPWQVTIAPISSAEELPVAVDGTEDAVFLYSGERAGWVFHRKQGSDRLLVYQAMDLTPRYRPSQLDWIIEGSQTVQLEAGPSVVAVSTQGGWSATAK